MHRIVLIILIVFFAIETAADVITVEKAVEIALQKNEDILIARQELENSTYVYREALSGAFPKIEASASLMRELHSSGNFMSFYQDNLLNWEVSLVQPIWVGGKVGTGIQIAKIYEQLNETKFTLRREEITVRVQKSFYNALIAAEARRVMQLVKKDADQNLENIELMYEQGLVSEYDLIQARVRVKSLEPTVLQFRNQLTLAENALKSDLGMDLDAEIEVVGTLSADDKVDTNNYKQRALANRKELKLLDFTRQMVEKNKRLEWANHLPTITAVGQYTYTGTSDNYGDIVDANHGLHNVYGGIAVQVPIFRGGETKAKVDQAQVEIRKAELEFQKKTRLIELQAELNYHHISEARLEIDLQEAALAEAEKGLQIANVRYENGVGTQLEVINAQTALEQARLNRLSAIHHLINATIDFKFSVGELIN